MKRRESIILLATAAAAHPLAARAQPAGPTRHIVVLMGNVEGDPLTQGRLKSFRDALRQLNWIEGNNLRIDFRWGGGDPARIRAQAAEAVGLAPDAIFTTNTPPTRALQQATRTIPIVFAGVSDPVSDGFVASLSKPGGNLTGFSNMDAAMAGKWMQFLKEITPGVKRIAVLYNPDTAPHSVFLPALDAAAPPLGVTLVRATVREPGGIDGVVAGLAGDASLVVMPDVFTFLNRAAIIAAAARHRVPAVYPFAYFAIEGGLIAYGPDSGDQFRRAAAYVDRILKGAKPADLPVQAPAKFDFVVNQKTARAQGIVMPPSIIASADEVIE
ncbi:MAG: ABC transporter substrate-binding protein [Reyranella sp.]|uniref:ABC transporter substrate-binding protein n=1 Tax=Reyranella sp. TaxID=1929291 RepID=UPI001225DDF0|nr:ABC transporter substrate-binding protein [Reyranella sp.]TAJ35488.1 MAG: ABC transporter substrate-binding protein [Reyranella sp.]